MATRKLVMRTWTPAASTLGRYLGTGMPPPARSQFLHAVPSQNGVEYARDLLKKAKKEEKITRSVIKWSSRGIKVMEWACYFCVSVTVACAMTVKP
ncbi:unnamed protein product [Urochloa decumbens]|uniref:Uncharacterized protein n=1 Tax=Urochloa decumbens TaxID=240449 RepID=A0ABC8VH67_9POAL